MEVGVKRLLLALLAVIFVPALAREWVPFQSGAPERAGVFRVIESDARRTVVELDLAGVFTDELTGNGRVYTTIELGMAAGGLLTEVGSPQLPVVARFLAIPDDRAVQVRVLKSDEVSLTGYNIYPAQPPPPENRRSVPFTIDEKRYGTDEFYPDAAFRVSDPMIMRDVRLVQLVLQPARYNPVTGELRVTRHLRVELAYDGKSNVNVKHRTRPFISRTFEPLYREFIANYDFGPPQRAEDGSYLIITNDAFESAVAPFAAWKQRKGWRTKVVTLSELGGNDTARIFGYIHDAYQNWPYPPDYVLLVGDAPEYLRCNHWPGHSDASDLYYSLHEGSDILADLMISRVCVRTPAEAEATLNKLYKYEQDPYVGNAEWFGKVCALAGYEGNPRFWSMVIRVRNYTMGRPFAQFDTLFERWGLATATGLRDSLNLGRAWMLYRGHGEVQGWANVSGGWTNSNVLALNNGRMVPCVIGPTCLSGDFDNAVDCHAETWVKAGEEKGGCGYFGSSEVSYSGYNDSLATGTFLSYVDSLHYTFAQTTQWGKLFMLMAYPLPNQITEEEIYMFNNFGEPELNLWSATPRQLTVDHPATVLIGSFPFGVTVSAGDVPVANALVCVMSATDTTIYHVGHTDASGQVQFTLNTTRPGDSIYVTVTGRNLYPYKGAAMTIAPNSAYVTYLRSTPTDSPPGGNNDGIINPGEAIRLPVWVKNWGSVAANSVSAKLRTADPNIMITDSVRSFGTIGAGDSAWTGANGFGFSVATACTNGYSLRFQLVLRDANDSVWISSFGLWVGAPVLGYAGQTVNDCPPGGNGDGKIDPGETAQLMVTLRNSGMGHGYNVAAVLQSGDRRFHVSDSTGAFGLIPADSASTNTSDVFVVHADDSIPREAVIPCTLVVTADGGYRRPIAFTVTVGEIRAVDPIPDGPRQPAVYWAYDDVDTNYRQHPGFAWVEIRGIGTRLTLSDDQTVVVSLPTGFGPWTYYGQDYTHVSICGNDWVAPGSTTISAYSNTALPTTTLPAAVLLNWDDLYPPTGGGVWYYHDEANHRFIVEWDSVAYYSPRTTFEKFQLVLYDATVPSPTGDNVIDVQYLWKNGFNSSTVGLQDHTRLVAIQYLFDGTYHRGAASVAAGRAIRYVTGEPSTGVAQPEAGAGLKPSAVNLAVGSNPSPRKASIRWTMPTRERARLAIFDVGGRLTRVLVDASVGPGEYVTVWDGRDFSGRAVGAGTYLCRLETERGLKAAKLILVR